MGTLFDIAELTEFTHQFVNPLDRLQLSSAPSAVMNHVRDAHSS
jgi:hypothetical protein